MKRTLVTHALEQLLEQARPVAYRPHFPSGTALFIAPRKNWHVEPLGLDIEAELGALAVTWRRERAVITC